ncbi:MAG TPA: nuclear transport factor 2 family protein [Solirubrobacterales bacterium]|nr:nuclear transport factor 2 family protein [Solirubrobacterales bacterium]
MSRADDAAQENLRTVRIHYADFASGNIDGLLEGLDQAVTIQVHDEHGVKVGAPLVGHDEARGFFEGIIAAVEDSTVEIEDLRIDGDRILANVRLGGTLRKTGKSGSIRAVHLFTVFEGSITSLRTHRPDWRNFEAES